MMKNKELNYILAISIVLLFYSCSNLQTTKNDLISSFNKNLVGEWRLNSIGTSFTTKVNNKNFITPTQLYMPFFDNDYIIIKNNGNLFIGKEYIGKVYCFIDSLLISYDSNNEALKSPLPLNRKIYFNVKKNRYIELRFKIGNSDENAEFYYSLIRSKKGTLMERNECNKIACESVK